LSAPRRLAAALVLLALAGPVAATADVLQDLGATFDQVAQELADAFPKVESRVVLVEGDEVRLAGSGIAMLRPGLEMVAYRKGEPFRHPITAQVLGHAEEEVAVLVVTAVADGEARARVAVTEGGRAPMVGDGARITAGRIPVAVLPTLGVNVPGETGEQTALLLVSRFSALLEKTGRFLTVEPRRVIEVAAPSGAAPPPSPLEVAQKLRAPAIVVTRLVQDGPARHLETSWISGRTGSTLVSHRTPLVRASFPPRFAWEQTPELERRYSIDGAVRGVAVADLDGDGRPELIVADERVVSVYRWQERVGLVPAGLEFRSNGNILSIDAADVNGSGRAQIVVVDYRGGGDMIESTVLELAGDRLRPLYETTGRFLRIVPVEREAWLLEQETGGSEPFASGIRRLVWRDGTYRRAAPMRTPAGVTVYGLALMRLTGAPEPDIVALTPEDRLGVWTAKGQRVWTSADPFGGAAVTFPWAPVGGNRERIDIIGRIFGRLVALPPGEEPEVLVAENLLPLGGQLRTALPRLAPLAFTQGRMHRLRWKDGGFQRVWQSQTTDGYIADFAFGDLDGDSVPEVVVGVVPRFTLAALNPVGRTQAQVVLYELP
jgi:VCBS repeat protein